MANTIYSNAPLVEVGFGVAYKSLAGLRSAHLGRFWERLGPDFPTTHDKPTIGTPVPQSEEWFPLPRVWFENANSDQIIQVQSNRFHLNWRRTSKNYPTFDRLLPMFSDKIQDFESFIREHLLVQIELTEYQLTYTNHIFKGQGWDNICDVSNIFPFLNCAGMSIQQLRPKGLAWQQLFEGEGILLEASIRQGQEHAEERRDLFVFELTARWAGETCSMSGHHEWFENAHNLIIDAFGKLTSEDIQKRTWCREHD